MIQFFRGRKEEIYIVVVSQKLSPGDLSKLNWLFGEAELIDTIKLEGFFIGPRREMVTPWSTNAVEISQNMNLAGIERIELFREVRSSDAEHDPMLEAVYSELDQDIFTIDKQPEQVIDIEDISSYNKQEGLALSEEEIEYLNNVSTKIGRKLTDGEVFGFSQVNSEHCRHKIFNGTFIIDGVEKESSLFQLIKKTAKENPNGIVSAYKDNVAFVKGPVVEQFAPAAQDKPDFFETKDFESVLSLKAETHNFPTTVEPFNGAATGSGGEIRDRLAGGKGSIPLAGTAVYMTSYPRTDGARTWEQKIKERNWLYQTPLEILIKASNGASDFGNKFGQPLISGSLLTFEHKENGKQYGFDKVIMQAGGIGFGKKTGSIKDTPEVNDKVVVMGGDNYRIGMGGSAVSSVATGEFNNSIELNAIQRSNPEMQKRVANAIRAMVELDHNPVVSIHDHGAGGHLNCLSELLEETGGIIDVNKLPVGDPTLSAKEIIGNESQERMGLVVKEEDISLLRKISERERAPMYEVGKATGDMNFRFQNDEEGKDPINWSLEHMFGSSPKTILKDKANTSTFDDLQYSKSQIYRYLESVLQIEAVACKDWLTNKVDRSVSGKVATQQSTGAIQLPLNNVAVMALDFISNKGVATSIGHACIPGLINPANGSRLAIAEALTNLVWAPLKDQLKSVSLSANWMWPAKNEGEDSRLYAAVESISDFAIELGINVPTGKDSLSMVQKYPDGTKVYAPGTVIISAIGEVSDITKTINPALKDKKSKLIYVDFSSDDLKLGGSSFAQILNGLGTDTPTVSSAEYFANAFNTVQELISEGLILSGHDISSGGMITALLEMCFTSNDLGLDLSLEDIEARDIMHLLFAENPGVLLQVEGNNAMKKLRANGIGVHELGSVTHERKLQIDYRGIKQMFDIDTLRDLWFKTSYLLDKNQSGEEHATSRFNNYKAQPLSYKFPAGFTGKFEDLGIDPKRKTRSGINAAIIREKGVNGDREMAYAMHLAGFDVKDVHMTDLIAGREDLSDVHFIVFVGGFSNSDVLGSAKGWAGAFLYNTKAKNALDNFYKRNDTLSLGVCNGCQLMMELGLVFPESNEHPKMQHNGSEKFESGFVNLSIPKNNSIMLQGIQDTRLGAWVAHGEGRFDLPGNKEDYNIVAEYTYHSYPGNPNDSDFSTAAVCSNNGRHLAIMPHLERSIFPWNWPHYETDAEHQVSPWIDAFVNAKKWLSN